MVVAEINDQSMDVELESSRLLERLAAGTGKCCLISGGEPTVQLVPAATRGKGGRNQQLVLLALQRWRDEYRSRIGDVVFLSGGTDGEDGNTRVAGAWFDRQVDTSASEQELQPRSFLRHNDAFHFFEQAGGLLEVGETRTNVCDLRVCLGNFG